MEFYNQLISELTNMDFKNFLYVVSLFFIPLFFSKKAETLFFHLLYSSFGIYMLLTMNESWIIYDKKMLVGLGLLLPQIMFIIRFVKDSIKTIKMMSANTYYFFITIYYKILRFINWLKSTFTMLKIFFTTFSFKKENYYEEDKSSEQDYYYQQRDEQFYQEEQSYSKQKDTNYEEAPKKEYGKYERFYSDSAYVVLGVNDDDDFKTIKKAYRRLVREYHPDLNPDDIEKCTEITQLINSAWEKVERWKK